MKKINLFFRMIFLVELCWWKRKFFIFGIFDFNYFNNFQFGNVVILKDGVKRIYFYYIFKFGKVIKYRCFQIIIFECQVFIIDILKIDKVIKIWVFVIKDFVVDNVEFNNFILFYVLVLYIGFFEVD